MFKQQLCEQEHQYTTSSFFFLLREAMPKQQCGLACKYEIVFQILIYNWMQN